MDVYQIETVAKPTKWHNDTVGGISIERLLFAQGELDFNLTEFKAKVKKNCKHHKHILPYRRTPISDLATTRLL